MERRATLAPLGNPTFRALWLANSVSNLGGLIQGVGAAWLMTSLSSSSGMVALVQTSTVLPFMAFSLIAGALADNFDRRRVMLCAQSVMLVVSAALAAMTWLGLLSPWTLLAFTLLIDSGTALNGPSWQASVGDIVSREDLPGAISLNSMGFNLMRSIGPALGGLIVAFSGPASAFALNALSYIGLILVLLSWKRAPQVNRLPRENFRTAVAAGLHYVWMSPALLRLTARGFLFGIAATSVLALLPVVAREVLHGSALDYGLLLGCFGLGAITGVMAASRIRERFHSETVVTGGFVLFAVAALLLAFSKTMPLSCLALAMAGAAWVTTLSLFNTTMQLSTPRWVVGRAIAFYQTATFGGMALGSWIWGLATDGYGPVVALAAAGVVLFLGALTGRWFRVEDFGTVDFTPLGDFREPSLRLDLQARSGPVMIMVEFRIAQQDTETFLAVMRRRRRIRIRDGAQKWALLRDLESPDVWTESYHVPTWADYIRHNERRVKSDAGVTEELHALHRGTEPPKVHRMIERQAVPVHDDIPPKITDVT